MKNINVRKLMSELRDAGIVNGGCDTTGVVWDVNGTTQIQGRDDVLAVLAVHTSGGIIWDEVRAERAKLLSSCDWTQLSDAVLTIEERVAWQEYRQALRDIPQTFANAEEIIWPIMPGV